MRHFGALRVGVGGGGSIEVKVLSNRTVRSGHSRRSPAPPTISGTGVGVTDASVLGVDAGGPFAIGGVGGVVCRGI
jgi:hypothetical protein